MGGCIFALFFIADLASLTLVMWGIISLKIAIVIGAIPVIFAFLAWIGSKNTKPTEMICPNCKSQNIRIEIMNNGAVGVYDPKSNIGLSSNTTQKIGICNDCGTSFPFAASNEIQGLKKSALHLLIIFIICLVIIVWFGRNGRGHIEELVEQATVSTETET